MTGFDVYGLFISIMDRHNLSAFPDAFRCGLSSELRGLLLPLHEIVKCSLEWRGHGVALEKRRPSNEIVSSICTTHLDDVAWCHLTIRPTLVRGQALQINLDGEIIARLRRYNIRTVFTLKDILCTVLHKLFEAANIDGNEDLGLGFGCGQMVGNPIEVRDDLIN